MNKQELKECKVCNSTVIATVENIKGDKAFSCYTCGYVHNIWNITTEEAMITWNEQMESE